MKLKAVAAVVAPVFAVGLPFVWPKFIHVRSELLDTRPAAARSMVAAPDSAPGRPSTPAEIPQVEFTELHAGVEQGVLEADFRGNGRDWVRGHLTNMTKGQVTVQAEIGQMWEAGTNGVVLVRPAKFEIPAGKTADVVFETAATRSLNRTNEQSYRLTFGKVHRITEFITYVQGRQDLSASAIQTAVLALTENLPLSAVCKFPSISGELKSRFNTDAYRVETYDIVMALQALREAGVKDSSVVMTIDPQLKVEAMIDPLCRAVAMRYYDIAPDKEWDYWRKELLQGDASTRHYALYGIARFYPEIALEMHPKWARESRTTPVFRMAAVQALAETQRAEALPLLRELAAELGLKSELGRAAAGAAEYLESRLAEAASKQPVVAFRTAPKLTQF